MLESSLLNKKNEIKISNQSIFKMRRLDSAELKSAGSSLLRSSQYSMLPDGSICNSSIYIYIYIYIHKFRLGHPDVHAFGKQRLRRRRKQPFPRNTHSGSVRGHWGLKKAHSGSVRGHWGSRKAHSGSVRGHWVSRKAHSGSVRGH